ncbi:Sugar transporter family protein [Fonsecaea pedrosoi]|nr:Sugar transporter family protein [Fonsecaea pedrosoi]
MELEGLHEKQRHYKTSTIFLVCGVSWGAAAYGYSASVISTTIAQPTFLKYMGLDGPNSTQLLGAANALFFVGGVFGSCMVAAFADKYGRKAVIGGGAAVVLVSTALLAASVHIAMFIVFRFFAGFGGYAALTGVPVWVAEIVPPKHRGILSDINPIFINIGYVSASWVGVGFFYLDNESAWRGPIALGCLPPLLCLISLWFVPESPRYLLLQDRADEAWEIIRDLHSFHGDESFAQREFHEMKTQILFDRSLSGGYRAIFKRPSYRKRALMTMGLIFTLVSSGVLVIGSYNNKDQLLLQASWLIESFLMNLVALLIIDRLPRPTLITIGLAGCVVVVSCEAALVATYRDSGNKAGLGACVAFLYMFNVTYGCFLDGVTWWYTAEIFPTHLRAHGMTLNMAMYALTNIIWLQAAPTAFANIGWKYYLFFICITTVGTIIIWWTFPDTLNKPLEEVAQLFGDNDLVVAYQDLAGRGNVTLAEVELQDKIATTTMDGKEHIRDHAKHEEFASSEGSKDK